MGLFPDEGSQVLPFIWSFEKHLTKQLIPTLHIAKVLWFTLHFQVCFPHCETVRRHEHLTISPPFLGIFVRYHGTLWFPQARGNVLKLFGPFELEMLGFVCHIKSSADRCEILQFVLQEIYLKKRMIGWFYIFIIPFLTESAIQGSVFAYLRSYWRCTMLVVPSTKGSFCGDAPWHKNRRFGCRFGWSW